MFKIRSCSCWIALFLSVIATGAFAAGTDYYDAVEFIASDGNQYIDTLWTNGSDHVVTLNIQPTVLTTTSGTGAGGIQSYYGCRKTASEFNVSIFLDYLNNSPTFTVDFNNSNYSTYRLNAGGISADRRYVIINSAASRTVIGYDESGNVVSTASDTDKSTSSFSGVGSAYLFAVNNMSSGSPAFLWNDKAKMKFYGGTVETVGGTACCNLVPCLKNGVEPGVYDSVRDVFLPNSGSGTFAYGAKTGVVYGEAPEGGDTPGVGGGMIPEGYTEIEYIQGDGSSSRILTDYVPQPNIDKIEAVVSFPTVDKTSTIWCTRGATSSTDSWTVFMVNDSGYKFRLDYGTSKNGYASPLNVTAGVKYTITAEDKRIDVTGGTQPASYEYSKSSSFTAGGPISLFASYWNGTGNNVDHYGKHRLYSFKVWRSGELIHYFVPCKDSNGAATLVDICFSPATLIKSGTFGAGREGHFYDDSLFTIPDDTLVVSGIPSNYGSPSPAYGRQTNILAGDTFTVSCGATVVTNGSDECIYQGWKICDALGNVLTNGLESSFTYEHPTPAEGRRLVWEWKTRPVGADVTDLLPTLCLTFDEQSLTNTGSGSISLAGGTPAYIESDNGYAHNTPAAAPYGSISGVFAANRDSAIAVLAKLGTKSTGILFHFKNGNTSIMLRRGTTANQLVLTENNSSSALITVNDIEEGDTKYHLYVINILSDRVDLYVDGVFAGTTTTTPRAANLVNWQFGGRHGGVISGEAICGGPMDDLRVYPSALSTDQMKDLAYSLGLRLSQFSILPIPTQYVLPGIHSEPGFTITNRETGASWVFAEGGVASGAPFDIAYSYADGVGTVTATGKVGSEAEGETLTREYIYTDELLVNGGFESGSNDPGWTGGIVGNASSGFGPNTTTTFISGKYCAIIQMSNHKTQVFTNESPCRATLSWKCKHRTNYNSGFAMYYTVLLDGEVIYPEEKTTGSDVLYRSSEGLILAPGEHTLKFQGRTDNNQDSSLFLDDVSLRMVMPLDILPIPAQSCAAGACRPEFIVSNVIDATTWKIGGNIVSEYFDVEYTNNAAIGTATVTAIGKGELAGNSVSATFDIIEDDIIATTAHAGRRLSAGGNVVYVFTNAASARTITARKNLFLVEALLVGGGGAGGINFGGGGGAGGVIALDGVNFSIESGESLPFSVGAGGRPSTSTAAGNIRYGGDTSISIGGRDYLAKGGGGGGNVNQTAGLSGGSGGGGTKGGSGGAGTEGQGYAGAKAGNNSRSGGGGGAGHAGYQYTTEGGNRAGNGGEGVANDITGALVYYGGGGGGGGSAKSYDLFDPGYGGLGGGGDGGKNTPGQNGADGFGGGGGGGGYNNDCYGGIGGSGTVILSFKVSDFDIDPIEAQFLAPGGCTPDPIVRDGGTLLVKDADYTVSYENNSATGVATITITGINDYAGRVGYVAFDIFNRYFAKPEVDEEGDGLSWETAMSVTNFFATFGVVDEPCEVWIEAGTVHAPSLSITNNAALTIRGGFAGTETTLAERQPGALTVFDGETTSTTVLKIESGTDDDIVLDRLNIRGARANGFIRSGKGGLKVTDCVVEANGREIGTVYGRGMNVQSDGYGSLVVSNCIFAGNRNISRGDNYGGFGIYIVNFKNALVDRSLFVTNGLDLLTPEGNINGSWGWCGANARGSSIYANNTPITVSNCRFAGNNCPLNSGTGGVVYLAGASGGSVIDHCTFIGNSEHLSYQSQGGGMFGGAGALVVNLANATDKVSVNHCTFAYNLTCAAYSAGGISVVKGDVDIDNSIFWKNFRYNTTTVGYGLDVHVSSTGTANIRHSTVTALDGTALGGAGLTYDPETVFAVDPMLVTTTEAFTNLLKVTSSKVYYNPGNATRYEDLASMDAHLLSPAGYVVNGGEAGPETSDYSPAIDHGDPNADCSNEPAPNGGRLNAGAFGNTAEASFTTIGQPKADVEVLYLNDEPRPLVRITMGIESGVNYSATVRLVCSTGGVSLVEEIYYGVSAGQVIENKLPSFLQVGTDYVVSVLVNADGSESRSYTETKTATGTLPPYHGKGGGPNVIHVRTGADCKMDGTSWTDAYPDLGTALNAAPGEGITEIWLAVTNDYMTKAITLAYPLTIRGGFTGGENSPEERPEGAMTWLDGNNVYRTMEFTVPQGALLTVERIRFSHSSQQLLKKSGKGNLRVLDCLFTDCRTDGSIAGRGIYATGAGTVAITNCNFMNLIGPTQDDSSGGGALCFDACAAAYVDHCLFVTNGTSFGVNGNVWARYKGAAAYINATPTVFSNCRFAACGAALREATVGGVVEFTGASGGSKIVNCAFVGNSDFQSYQIPAETTCAGAIAVVMSDTNQTLDVENCTIAYNITQGKWNAAGITIGTGTVNLKNSIIYGNVRGWKPYVNAAGADIAVRSKGILNMSYSLVTGSETNYISVIEGGITNIGPGMIYGNPLMVSTTNDFQKLLTENSTYRYLNGNSPRAACAALDAHLRSSAGYLIGENLFRYKGENSPAIDAGDPDSDYSNEPNILHIGGNGKRVNMGAYGNTPEASLTKINGLRVIIR